MVGRAKPLVPGLCRALSEWLTVVRRGGLVLIESFRQPVPRRDFYILSQIILPVGDPFQIVAGRGIEALAAMLAEPEHGEQGGLRAPLNEIAPLRLFEQLLKDGGGDDHVGERGAD
jgi:hypothetical protein